MAEFVYLYRSSNARQSWSAEQSQQAMQRWMAWLKDLTDRGHIKDPGHPLERAGKLITGKALGDHFFRREAGRVVAALTHLFGVHNLALVEHD